MDTQNIAKNYILLNQWSIIKITIKENFGVLQIPWTPRLIIVFKRLKKVRVSLFIFSFTKMHFAPTFYSRFKDMLTLKFWYFGMHCHTIVQIIL